MRPSAPKKSFSKANWPIFACNSLDVDDLGIRFSNVKGGGRIFEELSLPLRDEIGVNVEAFRKLGDGLIALDRSVNWTQAFPLISGVGK